MSNVKLVAYARVRLPDDTENSLNGDSYRERLASTFGEGAEIAGDKIKDRLKQLQGLYVVAKTPTREYHSQALENFGQEAEAFMKEVINIFFNPDEATYVLYPGEYGQGLKAPLIRAVVDLKFDSATDLSALANADGLPKAKVCEENECLPKGTELIFSEDVLPSNLT